jgi:hypothetical protein
VSSKNRKKRVPLGVHHSKLSVPPELIPDNKVGRWVNDVDNRVEMAQNGGYEFVASTTNAKVGGGHKNENTDIGGRISKIVGSKNGKPMRAYLMMINRDWYEEDQAKKQEKVDEVDRAIKHPGFLNRDKTYGNVDYKA